MQPNLEQLKNPALDLLNDVYNYLEELAGEIQAQTFIRFPGLGEEIMEKILEIMQDDREKARYLVESVLDSEQIYMFTNDTEYLNTRTDIVTVTYFTIDRKIGKKSKRLLNQVLYKALELNQALELKQEQTNPMYQYLLNKKTRSQLRKQRDQI